jgi:type IV pilus assembly protein PilB
MDAYKVLLGEILVQRKRITREQLDAAMQAQKQKGELLGEILIGMGLLDERDIVVALVIQGGLPYIAVNKYAIDPQIVRMIPKEVAQKEKVIALDRIGDVLSVVMVNPLTDDKKDYLESLTKCQVATFISTKTEIEEAIARNY